MVNLSLKLLVYFVKRGVELFGERVAIYNVHSLLHLVDDVKLHGPLDMNSSFKYENYMQYIKVMVRNGKNPLTQIVNRLEEIMKREIVYVNDRSNEPVFINTIYIHLIIMFIKKLYVRLLLLIMIIICINVKILKVRLFTH